MRKIVATDKAPAAIGPYAQANIIGDLVITSGQIPIDPATGYAVDPNTGAYVDPVTGAVYGESFEGGEAEGETGEDTTEDMEGDTGTESTGTENTGQDTTAGTQ